MKLSKNSLFFLIGGSAYVGLELLWRGRSHGSMFLTGGSCFLLLGRLSQKKLPLPLQMLGGAGVITLMEYTAGLLFNRNYQVWDYRQQPLNFQGQICLPYCFLWMPVSLGGMALYRWLDRKFMKKT